MICSSTTTGYCSFDSKARAAAFTSHPRINHALPPRLLVKPQDSPFSEGGVNGCRASDSGRKHTPQAGKNTLPATANHQKQQKLKAPGHKDSPLRRRTGTNLTGSDLSAVKGCLSLVRLHCLVASMSDTATHVHRTLYGCQGVAGVVNVAVRVLVSSMCSPYFALNWLRVMGVSPAATAGMDAFSACTSRL